MRPGRSAPRGDAWKCRWRPARSTRQDGWRSSQVSATVDYGKPLLRPETRFWPRAAPVGPRGWPYPAGGASSRRAMAPKRPIARTWPLPPSAASSGIASRRADRSGTALRKPAMAAWVTQRGCRLRLGESSVAGHRVLLAGPAAHALERMGVVGHAAMRADMTIRPQQAFRMLKGRGFVVGLSDA